MPTTLSSNKLVTYNMEPAYIRDVHETFLAEAEAETEAETEAFWPETEARPRRLSTCPRRDRDRGV